MFMSFKVAGCNKCFHSTSYNLLKFQTRGYFYKVCCERTRFIKNFVKNFVEIWMGHVVYELFAATMWRGIYIN